jgi:5-methylcytosine-specific restriction endonuclease McrA
VKNRTAYQLAWQKKQGERWLAYRRAWYRKHAERLRIKALAYAKARYPAKRKDILAAKRAWNKAHPEKYRALMKARNLKYRIPNNIRAKARYAANPEKIKAKIREWVKANPDHVQMYGVRKRARKRAAPVCDFTKPQWEMMKKAADGRCHYCGCVARLTIDHKQPLALGGSHTEANIVPACRSCNSRKNVKPYEDYLLVANA